MLIEINEKNIDDRLIIQATKILKKGGLIIIPTDTVYAIACDLNNKKGLNQLSIFKKTPLKKAKFSIICANHADISKFTKQIDRYIFKILKKNLPGPFTFVMIASNQVSKIFNSNKKEIGIRIPNNLIVQRIVNELKNPIAVSSIHDTEDQLLDYFIDPNEIYERFEKDVELVINGGAGKLEASTVVNLCNNEIEILREGAQELSY